MASQFNTALWGGQSDAPGAVTAEKLIYRALRLLQVLRPGQTASVSAIADCFEALNDLVDSWSTEHLMVPQISRRVYALKPGQSVYTIGIGGDIDTPRPVRIVAAAMISGAVTTAVIAGGSGSGSDWATITGSWNEQQGTWDAPAGVQAGSTTSTVLSDPGADYERPLPIRPSYAQRSGTMSSDGGFPLSTITLSPAPSQGDALVLYTDEPLTGFADLTTAYMVPPGYALALRYNLAAEIAPMFEMLTKAPVIDLERIERYAIEFKARIKRINMPVIEAEIDSALLSRPFDITRGY